MKADADAAADEDEDEDEDEESADDGEEGEAMDLSEVQERLESCSEVDLKKMLKEMELPVAGTVGAPAPSTIVSAPARPRHGPQQRSRSISLSPPQPQLHMPAGVPY